MKLHRLVDTPIALRDVVLAEMLQDMRERIIRGELDEEPKEEARSLATTISSERNYDVIQRVAIIPITGVLVDGYASWGENSYGDIASTIGMALADDEVSAIALQIGSPGGEVSGLFDFADSLFAMRGGDKPIWSIVDDHAYSAAYAIASATDKIMVPRTGGVGSIGVISMHVDISKLLEDNGIKTTIIQYGERKSDYSLFKPLSDAAKARLQSHIDTIGEMFVEMVGRNRNLARSRVRATEAGLFMGADGVEAGLADAVMSPQDAFAALVQLATKPKDYVPGNDDQEDTP